MKNYSHYIGIDVSKKTLDIHALKGSKNVFHLCVSNDKTGYKTFAAACKKHGIEAQKSLLCLENTGVYGYLLALLAQESGYNVWIENPVAIKRSLGLVRGKSDKIDAYRIAMYALRFEDKCQLWQLPRETIIRLKTLLANRKRLLKAQHLLANPLNDNISFLSKKAQKEDKNCSKKALAVIKQSIKEVDAKMQEVVKKDEKVSHMLKLATSVDGIGPQIAIAFIVATNEFKSVTDSRKLACYAGVAPFEHSSGTSVRGKSRVSHMANKSLKTILHLGALSAIQHSPELKAYYDRKVAAGKPKLSVINAVKNKLIARMCACIRDNRIYEKNYTKSLDVS